MCNGLTNKEIKNLVILCNTTKNMCHLEFHFQILKFKILDRMAHADIVVTIQLLDKITYKNTPHTKKIN